MMSVAMLPTAIVQVLQAHSQKHAELTEELHHLSILSQEEAASHPGARLILLQDEQGPLQAIFPSQALVDIDALNKKLNRSLTILPQAKYQDRLSRLKLQAIPAIPALTELPVVADNALQQLDEVVLEAGQPGQWFKLSGAFFRSLLDGAQWVDFSIPLDQILINRHDSQRDLDQINTAISKFTLLRIQQRLEDTLELPPLPDTAQRILKLRTNPDASVAELAEIVETDPSLSAQVVSWAGSSFYAAPGRVRSVQDAIIRILGFDLVMNLSMGLALGRSLKLPQDAPEGLAPYWKQAVWIATLTSTLAALTPSKHRPEFGLSYLAGLLHNFGYLVLAHVFPPHFSLICRYTECNRHLDVSYVEQYLLGFTREQIGSKLMELWNMPPEVITALRHQKNPEFQEKYAEYANLIFTATQLLRGRGVIAGPAQPIPEELYQRLHLDPAKVEKTMDELLEAADELASIAAALDQV